MRRIALFALPLLAMLLVPGAGASMKGLQVRATTVFDGAGAEPNVTLAPHGQTVLVDGLDGATSDPSNLFRSTDGGRTFNQVRHFVPQAGGSDWDMHFLSDKVVIAADLAVNEVYVDISEDAGRTWRQTTVRGDPALDRPWITGRGNDVYLTMKGFDGVPYLYVSHDLGRTFTSIPILLYGAGLSGPLPTDAFVTNQNAYVDSMTVDPRSGIVYILYGIDTATSYPGTPPLGAPNNLYVAQLDPESSPVVLPSYPVYQGGANDAFYAGFNWLTVDSRGTVYVVGNGLHDGHQSAWLSSSHDRGKTWSSLVDVGTPKVSSVYTAITPIRPGTLALAYYEGTGTDANTAQPWYATMAVVAGADGRHPVVVRRQHVIAQPVHTKDICLDGILCGVPGFGNDRTLLDYLDIAVGPDGALWGVFASDGPATGGGRVSTVLVRAAVPR